MDHHFSVRQLRRTALVALTTATMLVGTVTADARPSNNNNSEKLRAAVTLDGVRRHQAAWQDIADANGGNRFAGTAGHDLSAEYVADQLRSAGYEPTLQEFEYDAFFQVSPGQLQQTAPFAQTYVNGNDFRTMSYSGSGEVTAPVTHLSGLGCSAADFAGFPAGHIALVSRGACTFRLKTDNATAAGASAVLVYNNVPGVINGTLGATGLSAIPALGLTQSLGHTLRDTGGLTMRVFTDTASETLTTRNVLAELPGRNDDNVVMAGAHLDSVDAGPGINDNGSGSAAVLEVAIQMAKVKPWNTVRFAWWSAEESGLVGAHRYVDSLSQGELDRIALYLNFDMIGSPNFVRFIYDGDNSAYPVGPGSAQGPEGSGEIEQLFTDYFASQGLPTLETPFSGRSDYGPFIAKGIPAGGLFTGAEGIKTTAQAEVFGGVAGVAYDPCYHAACDTFDNNSDVGLDQMSDAVAHAVITYAQNTEAVNAVRGKGNFKPRSSGASGGGAGDGGGGGLHDDHEDEAA